MKTETEIFFEALVKSAGLGLSKIVNSVHPPGPERLWWRKSLANAASASRAGTGLYSPAAYTGGTREYSLNKRLIKRLGPRVVNQGELNMPHKRAIRAQDLLGFRGK
jgi:hypothetical protein